VPNVNGMVLSDAIYLLENAGYKVRFSGKGRVKMQIPEPGTSLGPNQKVELLLNI
jgi:cell division protein FtsI (penicillin-binding protein 3)